MLADRENKEGLHRVVLIDALNLVRRIFILDFWSCRQAGIVLGSRASSEE